MPLSDFSRLDERIGHVCDKVFAANGETLRGDDIRTADRTDPRARPVKSPAAPHKINEAVGVIRVHVSEENRVQLLWPDSELR